MDYLAQLQTGGRTSFYQSVRQFISTYAQRGH